MPKFTDEYEKICNDLNKDLPGYDYHNEDDSLDGRLTVSNKGVHIDWKLYSYGLVSLGFT